MSRATKRKKKIHLPCKGFFFCVTLYSFFFFLVTSIGSRVVHATAHLVRRSVYGAEIGTSALGR